MVHTRASLTIDND
ncbi:hypothetical protein QZH41_000356 [Actinostola sp. cb2023]|nr:hypothetical protein QZH41_000356 [Actinostola sp. cb2023]